MPRAVVHPLFEMSSYLLSNHPSVLRRQGSTPGIHTCPRRPQVPSARALFLSPPRPAHSKSPSLASGSTPELCLCLVASHLKDAAAKNVRHQWFRMKSKSVHCQSKTPYSSLLRPLLVLSFR